MVTFIAPDQSGRGGDSNRFSNVIRIMRLGLEPLVLVRPERVFVALDNSENGCDEAQNCADDIDMPNILALRFQGLTTLGFVSRSLSFDCF